MLSKAALRMESSTAYIPMPKWTLREADTSA
jgi:hypothetical protein